MPRPARPWFRCYTEVFADRKLRRLPVPQRFVWFSVLSSARESPTPGVLYDGAKNVPMTADAIADYAGVSVRTVKAALAAFEAADMIERQPSDQAWRVINWGKRQFETDDVTARTRKHRDQNRNVPTLFPGTSTERSQERSPSRALATETETETETDPPPVPWSTNGGTRPQPVETPGQGDLIEQALTMAADRYARQQVQTGRGNSPDGLARWWLQENAEGARARAGSLLVEHDLTATQLADALGSANPGWLSAYRRRPPDDDQPAADPAAVAGIAAQARQRLAHHNAPETPA